MDKLHKVEVAAMWFYHDEYSAQKLGARDFYKRLPESKQKLMRDMVKEIEAALP